MNYLRNISHFLIFALICFSFACTSPVKQPETKTVETKTKTPEIAINRVQIDTTNFSIELPANLKIKTEQGINSMVYYITPIDTAIDAGEGGIYFGSKPQVYPPSTEYTKKEIPGVFLDKPVNWIEYVTKTYTQREIFIDDTNGGKIHAWCYSDKPDELERLFRMMNSIQKIK